MSDHYRGLRNYWYAACLGKELGHKKPIGRMVMGELIALWRDETGAPWALSDHCLHRNALLSEGTLIESGGKKQLACPYHGWTYGPTGALTSVPSEGPQGGLPRSCHTRSFPVREQDGLILVWMGAGVPDKDPFPMPFWNAVGWGSYYMVTPFMGSVTNIAENFMDVPHTVFVHKGWFRSRATRKVHCTVERTPDSVLVTYDQPSDSIGFTGKLLNPKNLPMIHTDKFYLPNVTRVDYTFGDPTQEGAAFIITSTTTPTTPTQAMVYTLISFKLGKLSTRLGRLLLPPYTRKVIEQDVVIMANQTRSILHHGKEAFLSTPADTLHLHIEALREQAFLGTPPLSPQTETCVFWI